MKNELQNLEISALKLEPDKDERNLLIEKVLEYTDGFLERLYSMPSYKSKEINAASLYEFPVNENGSSIEQLLDIFEKTVIGSGINAASRGHLGYIPGGGLWKCERPL